MAVELKFLGMSDSGLSERTEIVLLPIPFEGTVSYGRGAWEGPTALLRASQEVETFDLELEFEPDLAGRVHALPLLEIDKNGPTAVLRQIKEAALPHFAAGRLPIGIGGEHSITLPLVEAALASHPRLTVVVFDAHGDLRDSYDGTQLSHACVTRRLLELGINIVQVGIRSLCAEEHQVIRTEKRLRSFSAWRCHESDFIRTAWLEIIRAIEGPIYLSVDLDVLDPAAFPGTGSPEPGGLSWLQTCALLRPLIEAHRLVGLDVCELAPLPGNIVSDFTAARLLYKILVYRAAAARRP